MSKIRFKTFIFCLISLNSSMLFANSPVAYEVDPKAEVLGHGAKVKIQKEFCDQNGFNCDYVLYDGKGQRAVLIEDWSHHVKFYQFSANRIGFLYGATGSGHILTVIDDQNQQKQYADFKAMNTAQSCIVTYEHGLKNMPDSLVFYSVPDFRVRLVLNNKVPQFKSLTDPLTAYFEDNGDFSFNFNTGLKGEDGLQQVLIQKPCLPDYRIVMN